MLEAVLAYAFIIGFFAVEIVLRQGASARSLETTASDQGSTRLIGAAIGVAVILPLLLNLLRVGQLASPLARWLGLLIMVLGLGLRIWSMRVLGTYYSRTLQVAETQVIVMEGPYRVLRHPGYLGTILLWVGSGLALGNWIAMVGVAGLMLGIYGYRIRSEEAMLLTTFGESYQQYRRQTWRLVPFVY